MQTLFLEYVSLIFIIVAMVMLANKLRVAYPIILVLGGLGLSFIQFFSHITIDPELIFYIFLPPLLYEAAWQTSWRELWKWRRVITSFAFPIVILTSTVVAFASSALIPGFTLALGFLLGGIVSPPDAISATTIMRQVKAPRILVSVAEGESLLNDASALIVFRFALAAVITGQFYFAEAVGNFFLVIVMGIAVGLAIGSFFYAVNRWLPTTPSIEIVLSFLAPYTMYYFAEHFHFSGVLAVVAGGLFLSSMRHRMLTYQGRIQGSNVWSTIGFLLNGLVFMLIGLQLPYITSQVEEVSLRQAIWYGLVISLVLIVTRIFCTFGAAAFTRFISRYIAVADRRPGWKIPFVFGWSGMRGVVSLAAAMSVPLLTGEGEAFPYRNLILTITFVVILVTLVLQGLTLPWIIKRMRLDPGDLGTREHAQEIRIRKTMAETALKYLEQVNPGQEQHNDYLASLSAILQADLKVYEQGIEQFNRRGRQLLLEYQDIYVALLEEQRKALHALNRREEFEEELIRKYLSLVDLEEARLREKSMAHD